VALHARHVVAREGFTDFGSRPARLRLLLAEYGWTGTIGTVAIVLVYMLACVGLIKFFWRDPERNIFLHVICPLLGIAAFAYPLWVNVKPSQPYPFNLVFWIMLFWLLAGAGVYWYFRSRAPEKLAAVGRVLAEDEEILAEGKLASGPVTVAT